MRKTSWDPGTRLRRRLRQRQEGEVAKGVKLSAVTSKRKFKTQNSSIFSPLKIFANVPNIYVTDTYNLEYGIFTNSLKHVNHAPFPSVNGALGHIDVLAKLRAHRYYYTT